jgi:RNA methyltransferase, TrmH family
MVSPGSKDFGHLFEQVRRAATAKGRAEAGMFAAEGQRLLERALRAGWTPHALLLGQAAAREPELTRLLEGWPALEQVARRVPDALLLELAGGRRAGLVTALYDLPESLAVDVLLRQGASPAVFLVIVDVEEPGNVGALIRTALACGAAGVICVGATDPFHPKAVRTSLGSLFKLALSRTEPAQLLERLRAAGVHSLAAVARDGQALQQATWPRASIAVLVGNESRGLDAHWREGADARVSIDLCRAADSFCVNAAAAICLYEVQRRLSPGTIDIEPAAQRSASATGSEEPSSPCLTLPGCPRTPMP